jgi:glycosyltransferase involved in cell wall biosynthesis
MSRQNRVLMVFNAKVNERKQQLKKQGRGAVPYSDYIALTENVDVDYIDRETIDSSLWTKLIHRFLGYTMALVLVAFVKSRKYDTIYADCEPIGLPLAFLFKLSKSKKRLLFIAHWLTPFSRTVFLDYLKVQKQIDTIFVHTLAQQTVAIARCGFTSKQIQLIPYQIDTAFWSQDAYETQLAKENRIRPVPEKPYICSAGLECRDYGTLIKAIEGLDIELKLAVGSHWSNTTGAGLEGELPSNVKVKFYNYTELRELYANAALVVVPTRDVDHAAGITVILEAMGMGKTVISTRSVGQSDVINDQRSHSRGDFKRISISTFLRMFASDELSELQTGLYVNPGEVEEMRRSIAHLLENPEKVKQIGRNASLVVNEVMTVGHFKDRVLAHVIGATYVADTRAGTSPEIFREAVML